MGCGFSHVCGGRLFHEDDIDNGKSMSPARERRRTFFRSNSFKSGVLIKPSTTYALSLHRQEVDENDLDVDDVDPVVDVAELDLPTNVSEPHVYLGGGIPGVAVDEFTIEQPKYTGHCVGGRHSTSGYIWWGARTRAGNDSMGRRKENQDSFCIRDRFVNCDGLTFVCVLDGHGSQGAFVSHFVRDNYHTHVAAALRRHIPSLPQDPDDKAFVDFNMFTLDTIEDVFLDASCRMTAALEDALHLDISVSGTTAIALLFVTPTLSCPDVQPKVFVANVGDSRAVAGQPSAADTPSTSDAPSLTTIHLSCDHKPSTYTLLVAHPCAVHGHRVPSEAPRNDLTLP
ncbi:hypothetical protein, variant [Aphanomyces invadans]|uniref:PPM-type phosphatase domain-containing protein n=1 Tax=Aphanomyces invadans TaxID=157072 RepID=A0A024TJ73_9STRA|nr:hypothetical protein, variant [Aphanomyces invadans]ETV94029.1 hypothetical protein, variant [Aphanomyces invadans]|eukprot:XP_008877231.1 hypothetical protein, variant [Aphanomyces invadans]